MKGRLDVGREVTGPSGRDEVVRHLGGEDYIVRRADGTEIARRGASIHGWPAAATETPEEEEGGGGGGGRR